MKTLWSLWLLVFNLPAIIRDDEEQEQNDADDTREKLV
jgi:hypothetical protein